MKGVKGEYELVILHPSHFLIGNAAVLIKHPLTQNFTCFYASKHKDGHLREGSPTGPPLPPLHSRGKMSRTISLNPILVNYAAMVRLRRLIRQNPKWGSTLSQHLTQVLRSALALHEAVIWAPVGSWNTQLKIIDPHFQPPLVRHLREYLGVAPRPSSPPGPNPGIETGMPTTALDRAFALLEAGSFLSFLLNCHYILTGYLFL